MPGVLQVLSDPRQKRFFKSKDMRDLFTLGDQYVEAPETATIFAGLDSAVALDRTPASRPASAEPAEAAAAPSSAASAPAGVWPTLPECGGIDQLSTQKNSCLMPWCCVATPVWL